MKDTKKINLTELNLNLDEEDLKQEIKSLKVQLNLALNMMKQLNYIIKEREVVLEQQQIQQIEKEYKYNE